MFTRGQPRSNFSHNYQWHAPRAEERIYPPPPNIFHPRHSFTKLHGMHAMSKDARLSIKKQENLEINLAERAVTVGILAKWFSDLKLPFWSLHTKCAIHCEVSPVSQVLTAMGVAVITKHRQPAPKSLFPVIWGHLEPCMVHAGAPELERAIIRRNLCW